MKAEAITSPARQSMKWARGLNRTLVQNILGLDLDPGADSVSFRINQKDRMVSCFIRTTTARGMGSAICSLIDQWDCKRGRNLAAGRALKALLNRQSSEQVRGDFMQFLDTWTKRQIVNVLKHRFLHKSAYIPLDRAYVQVGESDGQTEPKSDMVVHGDGWKYKGQI